MTRLSLDEWAMGLAAVSALRATCYRRKVGAVLLNSHGHVLSTGYNGVAAGQPHCNAYIDFVPPAVPCVSNATISDYLNVISECYAQYTQLTGVTKPISIDNTTDGRIAVTVRQWPNACIGATAASGERHDDCHAIHAEANALLQCRNVYDIEALYVTTEPCVACTKLLLNTSCKTVVYFEPHALGSKAQALWTAAGREWRQLPQAGSFASTLFKD